MTTRPPLFRTTWARVCALAALVIPHGVARAETYRHDLFGVSLRVPAGFASDAAMARSRPDVLSAWTGTIGSAFAVLVIEHVRAAETETASDAGAKRLVDASLIGARCDAIEREKVPWRDRSLGALVGLVTGDLHREAHAVVDVPLIGGGALRVRLSTAAAQREGLSRALRALLSSVVVRAPAP